MIAYECAALGPDKTLAEKLKALGVAKDTYYKRLDGFKKAFHEDLYALVEQVGRAQATEAADGPQGAGPNQWSEVVRFAQHLKEFYRRLRDGTLRRPQIKLGFGPIFARTILAPFLRHYPDKYRQEFSKKLLHKDGSKPPAPEFIFEIDLSGRLLQLFEERQLDLYVSQHPQPPKHWFQLKLPFCLVCRPEHPAAKFSTEYPGKPVPKDMIAGKGQTLWDGSPFRTTLVLLRPHRNRLSQFLIPPTTDFMAWARQALRVVEVDSFDKAHGLVLCDSSCVTLSVPEFLDKELLQDLDILPHFEGNDAAAQEPIPPLALCVVRRDEEVAPDAAPADAAPEAGRVGATFSPPDEAKRRVLRHLIPELEGYLKSLENNLLTDEELLLFSRSRPLYYVRLVETESGRWQPAWAGSALEWRFLRNGYIKGFDRIEADRDPTGRFRGWEQVFSLLGRLKRRDAKYAQQCHLRWEGTYRKNEEDEESHVASFICDATRLRDGRDIVGQWSGRSNATKGFVPGGGYMVIADAAWPLLGKQPSQLAADEIRELLCDCAGRFQKSNRGLADPPTLWEWEVPDRKKK